MTTPVLMDVDTGIDDAVALVLAVRSPELDLVGVGTVAGNVDPVLGARNTLRVLEVAGAPDVPVAVGAPSPLVEPWADVAWIHGADGMGNTNPPAPLGRPCERDAVAQLLALSHEYAGELTVIAVGPLTNLALAIRLDPTVCTRLAHVVIMGGSARAGGNRGPWTEANVGVDPEAAAVVFDAPLRRTMVGLDVTMQTRLDDGDVRRLAASGDAGAKLLADLLPHYLDVYERTTGQRACAMHDPLAVAVAAQPGLVSTRSLPVRVETAGHHTRGMTVVDQRGPRGTREQSDAPRTDVALEVEVAAFLALLRDRLTGSVRGVGG